MALAVPGVYLSIVVTSRPDEQQQQVGRRLSPDHVADLRAIATGVEESDAGICCRYLVDQLAGGGGSLDVDDDGYVHQLEDVERFCDRFNVWRHPLLVTWRSRIKRARRTIVRLREGGGGEAANVLFVAYGHPDPLARQFPELVAMGELGSLARYTEAVEERRREMARDEARRCSPGDGDLARHRERYEWALRVISSADALRDALAPFSEQARARRFGESVCDFEAARAQRDEQKIRRRARVAEFASRVRGEAHRMLVDAEQRYHAAWLQSAV